MSRARIASFAIICFLVASVAFASWYDDYDAGINAAHKGQWQVVVQKMTAALGAHANEGDKERTYGVNFIPYHPHYYRGVAYLSLGKYDQAISEFEKTSGPGEYDLGSLDTLMHRAKTKLEAANTPAPETPTPPTPRPVAPVPVPVPVTPAAPSIDPGLRQRVAAEINNAKGRMNAAQQRKATGSQQYAQGTSQLTAANTGSATAKSNDDLNAALAAAQNAALLFDGATAPGAPPTQIAVTQPRPVAAADTVLAASKLRVRRALESYFRGDFDDASRAFESLSRELPNNAWIFAFLGASQYSQFAFEADEQYKNAALKSFKRAKSLRNWSGGLPDRYFSKRIRKVFETAG